MGGPFAFGCCPVPRTAEPSRATHSLASRLRPPRNGRPCRRSLAALVAAV
jgi:hypothetical protein